MKQSMPLSIGTGGGPSKSPPRGAQVGPRQRPVVDRQRRGPGQAEREGLLRQKMARGLRWQRGGPPPRGTPRTVEQTPFEGGREGTTRGME